MGINRLLLPGCLVLLIGISPIIHIVTGTSTVEEDDTVWKNLEHGYPNGIFHDVVFLNATFGWVVGQWISGASGNGIILQTTDGGETWHTLLQSSIHEQEYNRIHILDASTAWVTTNGGLVHTTNGGENWTEHTIVGGRMMMAFVIFVDSIHGWTATNDTLYKTIDGGESWITVSGWTFEDHPRHMQFVSSTEVWATGYFGIYHSMDGADTWTEVFSRGGWSLSMQSDGEGWAVSDASIMHTSDGSEWTELTVPGRTPFGRINPPYLTDVLFIDDQGWIVGTEIPVMSTPDRGTTWYEQSVREGFYGRLMAVDFLNQTYGWAVGSGGNILRTRTGHTLGNRLWNGMTDPLFLSIVAVVAVVVTVTVGGIIKLRHRKGKSPSVEIQ